MGGLRGGHEESRDVEQSPYEGDEATLGQQIEVASKEPYTIKLIKLLPRVDTSRKGNRQIQATIDVSLEEFSIDSSPPFIALSYVWGTDAPRTSIRVNEEPFTIRANLTMALRQFQTLCPNSYIWADAICINQSNEKERSHLVQHMGQIFNTAERIRLTKPLEEGGFPALAYSRFSDSVYWQRIWVLQEIYLARELLFCCGSKTMPSKTLTGALMLLGAFQAHLVSNNVEVDSNPRLHEFAFTTSFYPEMNRLVVYTSVYSAKIHSLRIAMAKFCFKELPRDSRSTDPRDMIYGLLGLANQQERGYINADYKKPVQEVYCDVTRAFMQRGWTDILAWSQPPEKRIYGLPSWVPDFSSIIFETMCSQGPATFWLPHFCAAASLRPTSHTGDVEGAYEAIFIYLSETKTFVEESIRLHPTPPPTIPDDHAKRLEATWRVPCADQLRVSSNIIRNDTNMQRAYKAVFGKVSRCLTETKKGDDPKISDEGRPYIQTALRWVKKRPMLSTQGYVGLVPSDTQEGDVLVLLQNCISPYILRPQARENEQSSYRLVGEAYVWGIMCGEYKPSESQGLIFNII
ncbi:HET-domain-containing protein [Xylariaceae sp. FL1651]|nr:HET-domain-containing protein [Xylariaceae sp. FL1651]